MVAPIVMMPHFAHAIPLSLYVHIPWCVRKCPYCDFNSHEQKSDLPQQQYIAALLTDLEQDIASLQPTTVGSVFIGGGTPSLFDAESIERLLDGVRARMDVAQDAEITLEANPGTVERVRFEEFRAAGVNRLSIGVQSFDDHALADLGRIHDGRDARRAAEAAHAAGFDNFNLDLMFGLPRQSSDAAMRDLRNAMALEPTHLSWYQLTIEPNTLFHARPPTLPDDDRVADLQERGIALLAEHGFARYEVSAFARTDKRCQHNLNYWQFGDYLGVGAGAHGKYTDHNRDNVRRTWKVKNPRDYLAHAHGAQRLGGRQTVPPEQVAFEFMLNALRLSDGFPDSLFIERTGLPLSMLTDALEDAQRRELLQIDQRMLQPTALGQAFLNDLIELFLPPGRPSAALGSRAPSH